jgi:iron only hydrogenase large subunit-like protein
MRYLVTAKLKPGLEPALQHAIASQQLGRGSVAGREYLRNMRAARRRDDGTVRWVEVCYCPTPLAEERPYWEAYFDLLEVKDAHARDRCRDLNGSEAWACSGCDCSAKLETRLVSQGQSFLEVLESGQDAEQKSR